MEYKMQDKWNFQTNLGNFYTTRLYVEASFGRKTIQGAIGLMVRIFAFQAKGRGSIPRWRMNFLRSSSFFFFLLFYPYHSVVNYILDCMRRREGIVKLVLCMKWWEGGIDEDGEEEERESVRLGRGRRNRN